MIPLCHIKNVIAKRQCHYHTLLRINTLKTMKKHLFFILLTALTGFVQAQDTLYVSDTATHYRIYDKYNQFGEFLGYAGSLEATEARKFNNMENVVVYGITLPLKVNPTSIDIIHGVIAQSNPDGSLRFDTTVAFYSERSYGRPYDCYIHLEGYTDCDKDIRDTVIAAYFLYFQSPVTITGDECYAGLYYRDLSCAGPTRDTLSCLGGTCYLSNPDHAFYDTAYTMFYNMGQLIVRPNTYFPDVWVPALPVLTPLLNTDTILCPEVEGFAFAGMNAGFPTLLWDTAGEHELYQVAYGPYDEPIEQLYTDTTRNWFIELTSHPLSTDIFYQARVRARCHHYCLIHDTMMWTAWSDPVFFYTGEHMPDTSHHQEEEGIVAVDRVPAFVLSPNPVPGSGSVAVTLTLPASDLGQAYFVLVDGAGRERMRLPVAGQQTQIPLVGLSAGVYHVTLYTPQGAATRRLVVEN